jgi:hypothetical protein
VSDTPEKRLIFAVLMDAIVQLQRSDERSVAEASSWIRDESEDVAVSFSDACEILGLELDHPLHCVVPALFERAGNQAIAGVGFFIAALCQLSIIAGPLDPSVPLRGDCFVACFQIG